MGRGPVFDYEGKSEIKSHTELLAAAAQSLCELFDDAMRKTLTEEGGKIPSVNSSTILNSKDGFSSTDDDSEGSRERSAVYHKVFENTEVLLLRVTKVQSQLTALLHAERDVSERDATARGATKSVSGAVNGSPFTIREREGKLYLTDVGMMHFGLKVELSRIIDERYKCLRARRKMCKNCVFKPTVDPIVLENEDCYLTPPRERRTLEFPYHGMEIENGANKENDGGRKTE